MSATVVLIRTHIQVLVPNGEFMFCTAPFPYHPIPSPSSLSFDHTFPFSPLLPTTAMNMDHWQPYLHTLLLSPSPYSTPEPFLFPSFLISSHTTFLLACLFTFTLALLERWLSFTLERLASKNPCWRTAVFATVTTTRYLLMIVVMGMDWVLLVSVVAGLTGGFAVGEWWKGRTRKDVEREEEEEEEVVELLRCEMGMDGQDDG